MIRTILKKFYYSRFGKILRYLPQKIYFDTLAKKHANSLISIEHNVDSELSVAFLLEYPEVWNSVKSIYMALKERGIRTYIITFPKNNDSANIAYEFVKKFDDTAIDYSNLVVKNDFCFRNLKPKYVFYTRPYSVEYPEEFRPNNVSKFAKICYTTYGYDIATKGLHLEVGYNFQILPYEYMIFFECTSNYDYFSKKLKKWIKKGTKKIYNIGYPRFDLLISLENVKRDDNTFIIFWSPRWTLPDDVNDNSSFFELFEPFMEYMSKSENALKKLIIRPHPLMFDNYIKHGVMTPDEVKEIQERIAKMPNVELDFNRDYLTLAIGADLFVSDFTSLIVEYLVLNRPIIYCGNSKNFNKEAMLIDSVMYHAGSSNDVLNLVDILYDGNDSLAIERGQVRQTIMKGTNGNIGKEIVNCIEDDFFNKKSI